MSENEIIGYLKNRYEKYGIGSLSYPSIKKIKGLYFHLYKKGLKIKDVIRLLGLEEEYSQFKIKNFTKVCNGKISRRWSWERVIEEVTPIIKSQGFLPPAEWFHQNEMSSVVFYVYKFGKDWNLLREHFGSYEHSDFVQSRNGLRWRSHPEASLSNFLFARGIEHKKGEKYPDEYSGFGKASYGYYDLHFIAKDGLLVDVEVWGDKPNGHNEGGYREIRKAKEKFNTFNKRFIGIQHQDCFDEGKLQCTLEPYIGVIAPYKFLKPADKVIQSTHWSNSDELIEYCEKIASEQKNGVFPTEEWLRKRGKWKDREGPAYNTVSIYIKLWIGGVRKLREILGQSEHSTISWSKEKAINEYRIWFEKYGFTASQAKTPRRNLSEKEKKRAQNITHAIEVKVGSVVKVNELLGIKPAKLTKWTREKMLGVCSALFQKYSLTHYQLANILEDDKILFSVEDKDVIIAKRLAYQSRAYFSGAKEIYQTLGLKKNDMRILRRKRLKR